MLASKNNNNVVNSGASLPGGGLLLNGDFSINQRGYGGTALSDDAYGHDRWRAVSGSPRVAVSGGVATVDHASGTYPVVIGQIVEAPFFANQTLYFSVEDPSADIIVSLAGEGVSGTIPAGGGRRGVSLVVPSDFTGDADIQLSFAASAGFARAKLEIGDRPSAWVPRNAAAELLACRRYYERITRQSATDRLVMSGRSPTATTSELYLSFVRKRAAPSIASSAPTGFDFYMSDQGVLTPGGSPGWSNIGLESAEMNLTHSSLAANKLVQAFLKTTGYIEIDAEL